MFRLPSQLLLLTGLAVAMTGCHVMYRDVYSPKRTHYVMVKEKEKAPVLPEEKPSTPPPATVIPPAGAPALPAGGAAPGAPAIPGLDAPPPPAAAPAPPAQ